MSEITRMTEELYAYKASLLPQEDDILCRLRAETDKLPENSMQISHDQACFMDLALRLMGAVNTLEIGVFTGYSALVTARALPENGRVTALDNRREWTDIARRYWKQAEVNHKIDLLLGDALDSLEFLLQSGHTGAFDFVFIDADKREYPQYYERSRELLRRGGMIMVDNAFRDGDVADSSCMDAYTVATRQLNDAISRDPQVSAYLAPVGDGLYLAVKK